MSEVTLVINETGMGNGVLELPFFLALAGSSARIIHLRSPFLQALQELGLPAAGVECAFVPAEWGMEARCLNRELRALILDAGVSRVVNLRNEDEGNEWNGCFAVLRHELALRGVRSWDLLDHPNASGPYIQDRWERMFRAHHLEPDRDGARALLSALAAGRGAPAEGPCIALCTGGSREDKCLVAGVWAHLVQELRSRLPDRRLRWVHGRTDRERELGDRLERAVGPLDGGSTVAAAASDLAGELSGAAAVVTKDSFPMHLAYALGRPTLGLFSTTSRAVWGPPGGRTYRALTSRACGSCSYMPPQGTCWAHEVCPAPPNSAWDPGAIAGALAGLLPARIC